VQSYKMMLKGTPFRAINKIIMLLSIGLRMKNEKVKMKKEVVFII